MGPTTTNQQHSALEPERIQAIETGGCPHAAIREDISANLAACEQMTAKHNADIVLVESGGGACVCMHVLICTLCMSMLLARSQHQFINR